MSFSNTVKRSWSENRLMSALLELTYACNLDCTFCYNDLAMGGQRLSIDQYRELLDDLASLGVLNLTLSGGEPLAHPRFFEIASYARELGFVIRIKTNGHSVREPVARRIREEIDPYMIEVSMHGATPETHDRQTRVQGSFVRLVANVRAMKSLGLRVRVNSVLTRWNENELSALLALCDELGVAVQIDPEVKPRDDGDRSPLEIEASEEGLALYRAALQSRAKRDSGDAASPSRAEPAREAATDKHCGAGSSTLAVDPYGRVYPCVQWRVSVGDLHEQRLEEIWLGSEVLGEVRETSKAVGRRLAELGTADEMSGFCPGAAHVYSGDPLSLYPTAKSRMSGSGRARIRLTVL